MSRLSARWLTRAIRDARLLADVPGYALRAVRVRLPGQPSKRSCGADVRGVFAPPGPNSNADVLPAFPAIINPDASIVVPVFNHLEHTQRCLHSLAATSGRRSFEVIVVDDGSTDGSAQWLAECANVRVHRMPANKGFIAACNAGADIAKGRFLTFLNNDTAVRPGWLDALLDSFESIPGCGLVGAKLIGPDGRLQEAGAIVFADGHACNYGRGGDPFDPRYDFVRDADYCSGACIALPSELFHRLGGFDSRYAPAYYEDTDLAFAVQAAGYRVVYQPRAEVMHFEGATAGTATDSGVKRYQEINRGKFISKWKAALAGYPTPAQFASAPSRHVVKNSAPHVLVVDIDYPRPERDSGSLRMFNILQLMRERGSHIQFWAMDAEHRDAHARALEDLGIEIVLAPTPLRRLRWWHGRGDQVDVVWLSRLPAAERNQRLAWRYAPQATFVFDTVDLHFLRYQRRAAVTGDTAVRQLARRFRRVELDVARRADVTLVVSEYERALLNKLVPSVDVRVLSNIHSVSEARAPFDTRTGVLFLGNFEHEPNIDAARWLLAGIMPLLRELVPGMVLHLVGYGADRLFADVAMDDVIVHGFVSDLDPLFESVRVALAPLRYGAGVKGKINLAMSRGLPVVATSVGAEGMGLHDGAEIMVADDPGAFAAAVARVYQDESLWLRLAEHGRESIRRDFSADSARRVLDPLLVMPRSRVSHAFFDALP